MDIASAIAAAIATFNEITASGVNAVLKQRIEFSGELLKLATHEILERDRKLQQAQEELVRVHQEVAKLNQQLQAHRAAQQFVEHAGVLWRRTTSGSLDPVPRCVHCRQPMSPFPPEFGQFCCDRCTFHSLFSVTDMDRIRRELAGL